MLNNNDWKYSLSVAHQGKILLSTFALSCIIAVQRVNDTSCLLSSATGVCVIELVIKQLKLSNDSSSADNVDEVCDMFRELEEHLPKVKEMALSAKRSSAATASAGDSAADCSNAAVVCSSRF